MGRVSFGSGGDWSSLFASLYGDLGASEGGTAGSTAAEAANLRYQYESGSLDAAGYAAALQALAATGDQTSTNHFNLLTTAANVLQSATDKATAEAKNAAQAAQNAADQNASDQWSNGVMSDQDWLAYVSNRVATAADVQDKAQWAGYLLKYTDQIGVNTAEGAYKAGGSINDLILFYQNQLATAPTHNTQEYRDAQVRLNDLQDQRSGTAVQDGANAIIKKINARTGTNQDLLKFYQQQLSSVRPGSDLHKQITAEIDKVQVTIATNVQNAAAGKMQLDYDRGAITGRAYAAWIRSTAESFKANDPATYYKMLEAAVSYDKNPGFVGAAGRARSAAAAKNKALAATVDQLQGQRDNLIALVSQADAGQASGYDAVTGRMVTFTPALTDAYDKQILDTYKALSAAHEAKGDHSAAQADMATMSKYITGGVQGTLGIIGHNTAKVEDTYTNLVLSTVKELQGNANSNNPDPTVVADVAAKWAKFTKSLEYTIGKSTVNASTGFVTSQTQTVVKPQLQSIDPGFLARTQALTNALQVQASPGTTPEQQRAANDALATAFGADPAFPDASPGSKAFQNLSKNLVDPAYQITASAVGLANGTVLRVVDSSGKIGYFPVAYRSPTDLAEGVPPQPQLDPGMYDPSKGERLLKIVVDINGRPTAVLAVATPATTRQRTWRAHETIYGTSTPGVRGPSVAGNLLAAKGDILTNDQVAALDKSYPGWRDNGTADLVPVQDYYSVMTPAWIDTKGQSHGPEVWVEDAATGYLYKNTLPVRGTQLRDDGTVQVVRGPEGPQPLIDYTSNADAAGVPAAYAGEHPELVGNLIGAPGGVDVTGLRGRDINGFPTAAPSTNPAFAYFDPVTDFVKNPANRDAWWQDAQRAQRATEAKTKAQVYADTTMQRAGETVTKPTAPSFGKTLDDLSTFGQALGLNMAFTPSGRAISGTPIPSVAGGPQSIATAAGPAPVQVPNVNSATGFVIPKLHLPAVSAPTFSGPTLSPQVGFTLPTLKTSALPTIRLPKTAADVTAAATAAAQKVAATMPKVVIPKNTPTHGALEY